MNWHERLRVLLPALWLGGLVCIATIAAPAAFKALAPPLAGQVVGRIFAAEAATSLALGLLVLLLERRCGEERGLPAMHAGVLLAFGTLFCSVAGYYALQPLMAAARLGQGTLSFGQLHAISLGFFGLKAILVATLAWRASGARGLALDQAQGA